MSGVQLLLPGADLELAAHLAGLAIPSPVATAHQAGPVVGALATHMVGILDALAGFLNAERHVQVGTGAPLSCVIYLTAAPEAACPMCVYLNDCHYIALPVRDLEHLVDYSVRVAAVINAETDAGVDALRASLELDRALEDRHSVAPERQLELGDMVKTWPLPGLPSPQAEGNLTAAVLFHDLLRLMVMHEFAHAACGHVQFVNRSLGHFHFEEFSPARGSEQSHQGLRVPDYHVFQALEAHADELAAEFSIGQVLFGNDPAGEMFGSAVDLVHRSFLLNVAGAILGVVWSIRDQIYTFGATFRVRNAPLEAPEPYAESGVDVIFTERTPFKVYHSSHPPAQLRYYRHQLFTQIACNRYDPSLGPRVAAQTFGFMHSRMSRLSEHFASLVPITPMVSRSPDQARLAAYEDYLVAIQVRLDPYIQEYAPTRAPLAQAPSD